MKKKAKKNSPRNSSNGRGQRLPNSTIATQRTYTIADYRLERPSFTLRQVCKGDVTCYEIEGDLTAPVPPIRESKYLDKKQCIEIYRWMLLNRKMETALEIGRAHV